MKSDFTTCFPVESQGRPVKLAESQDFAAFADNLCQVVYVFNDKGQTWLSFLLTNNFRWGTRVLLHSANIVDSILLVSYNVIEHGQAYNVISVHDLEQNGAMLRRRLSNVWSNNVTLTTDGFFELDHSGMLNKMQLSKEKGKDTYFDEE